MKKKKLSKAVVSKLTELLNAKSELEKSVLYDTRLVREIESRMYHNIDELERTQTELSELSSELEKKYGKASEFNIETGEIIPSNVFE